MIWEGKINVKTYLCGESEGEDLSSLRLRGLIEGTEWGYWLKWMWDWDIVRHTRQQQLIIRWKRHRGEKGGGIKARIGSGKKPVALKQVKKANWYITCASKVEGGWVRDGHGSNTKETSRSKTSKNKGQTGRGRKDQFVSCGLRVIQQSRKNWIQNVTDPVSKDVDNLLLHVSAGKWRLKHHCIIYTAGQTTVANINR